MHEYRFAFGMRAMGYPDDIGSRLFTEDFDGILTRAFAEELLPGGWPDLEYGHLDVVVGVGVGARLGHLVDAADHRLGRPASVCVEHLGGVELGVGRDARYSPAVDLGAMVPATALFGRTRSACDR